MKLGYARESTKLKSQDQPLEWHIDRLQRYGCDRVFVDRMSGASTKRTGYNEMMQLVESGAATEIVVTSLKRFGRSVSQIYKGVELIQSKGIKFTILDGGHDLSTATGRAAFGMDAILAQMERELIQERINAGYDWIRKNKRPIHAPFGYLIVEKELQINPQTIEIAQWIRRSVIDVGLIKTCQAINTNYSDVPKIPKSPGGIKSWLTCPTIYGHLRYGRRSSSPVIHYNNHPALFTEQEKVEVLDSIKFRQRHHGFKSDPVRFPFSGLIYCAECDASMQVSYHHDRPNPEIFYRCYNAIRKSCPNNGYTSVKKINKAVIETLVQRAEAIADKNVSAKQSKKEDPRLLELKDQLNALEKLPPNAHILAAIDGIRADIAAISVEAQFGEINLEPERKKALDIYICPDFWESIEPEKKKNIYRLLIKKVLCRFREVKKVELWV